MQALKSTGIVASTLLAAALLASPLAMAHDHGDRNGPHGKSRYGDICEKMERGDWEERREAMREKANERHEEMAGRLQLTDEQREIWDQIRDERRQDHQERFEKLKERCENNDEA